MLYFHCFQLCFRVC